MAESLHQEVQRICTSLQLRLAAWALIWLRSQERGRAGGRGGIPRRRNTARMGEGGGWEGEGEDVDNGRRVLWPVVDGGDGGARPRRFLIESSRRAANGHGRPGK